MLTLTVHTSMRGLAVSTVFVRDRELGPYGLIDKVVQMGYSDFEALDGDDVEDLVALVATALRRADKRAQEAGGWSLLV